MRNSVAAFALGLGIGLGALIGIVELGANWRGPGAQPTYSAAPAVLQPTSVRSVSPSAAAPNAGPAIAKAVPGRQIAQANNNAAREVPQTTRQMQLSFAPIVAKVSPAVVNVYATTVSQQYVSPFANDPFFGRFFGFGSPLMQQRPRTEQSLGSGVIVDPSGVIVTNSHVVNGATTIKVTAADGHEYDVDLVLNDTKSDLAVLKIKGAKGQTFPALSFANSDALQVGDLVLAIGNPFGVGQTVTSGIVSALARTGVESTDYSFFIQTDAAINPGNSGGALVDMQGRLVGINSAIYTRSGGSVGIGFAIPSNMVELVANAGLHGDKLVRPWFGARFQDLTPDLAKSLGLDVARGALIAETASGGSAAKAGLKAGDVITSIDGQRVNDPKAFGYRLATKPIGSNVAIDFVRQGQAQQVEVKVEAAPSGSAKDQVKITGRSVFAGATAETLSPPVAEEYGLSYSVKGVVLTNIANGAPADQVGFNRGDIILSVNGREVTNAATLQAIADTRGSGWQITMERNGRRFQTFVGG